MSGGDFDALGIKDSCFKVYEEAITVFGNVPQGEAMDHELALIGGKAEGEPRTVTDRKALIELSREGTKQGRIAGGGSEWRSTKEGDRTIGVDLARTGEGECAVGVPEDPCGNVRKGGSDRLAIRVRAGRLPGGKEPSGSWRQWRLWGGFSGRRGG